MDDGAGGVVNLFNADFMGNADASVNGGSIGEPLFGAGFYRQDQPLPLPADRSIEKLQLWLDE
jgi:hypothetical protein